MNYSKYDPDRIHQRRVIINSSIAILVLLFILCSFLWLTHLHRTPTSKQTALMKSNEPVVTMFYSSTCKDCKHIAFTANKNAFQGKVNSSVKSLITSNPAQKHKVMFLQYQNKHDQKMFYQYNVTRVPTIMVLKNGQPQPIKTVNNLPVYQFVGNNKKQVKAIYHTLQTQPQPTSPAKK